MYYEKDQIIINEKNDKEKVLAEMQQIKDTLSQQNKQNKQKSPYFLKINGESNIIFI